jgi:hypothetical protein
MKNLLQMSFNSVRIIIHSWEQHTRYGNTLRFPRAAGEPPRANALRGLTESYPPAGVSVYFLR